MTRIQALVVGDALTGLGIEIRNLEPTVSALTQTIECTYVEALIGTDWAVYFDDDGAGNPNLHATRLYARLLHTGGLVPLSGRCLFVGRDGSQETSVPSRIIDMVLDQVTDRGRPMISLFRHRKHLFVYDDADACSKDLLSTIAQHRDAADLDTVEAYYGITPDKWVELRVEIMDDWSVQLHDHRNDRSYG